MSSHAATHSDALADAPAERVYRMTWLRRGLALLLLVGLLLSLGFEVTEAGRLWTWGVLTDLTMVGLVAVATAHQLGTYVHVSDSTIRKVKPLGWDRTIRFGDVRRLHVPMVLVDSGVRLYTDPDGRPAMTIDLHSFEDSDDLLRQVARRLPDEAEVEDPAGRTQAEGAQEQ